MFTFQDGEENGAPGGGFNQAEDNSQVWFVGGLVVVVWAWILILRRTVKKKILSLKSHILDCNKLWYS